MNFTKDSKIPPSIFISDESFANSWAKLVMKIMQIGMELPTEYGNRSKDVQSTIVMTGKAIKQIENIELHPQEPFGKKRVLEYLEQFKREYDYEAYGFKYTYLDRLTRPIDQLKILKEKLKDGEITRRAQAITWRPDQDSWSTEPPCYDDKTEILTENGWKLFKNLNGEKVATLENGRLVYKKPIRFISYQYKGYMIEKHGNTLDFSVTPNHKMFVGQRLYNKDNNRFFSFGLVEADKMPKESFFTTECEYEAEDILNITIGNKILNFDDYIRFVAIYLSDGSYTDDGKGRYRIRIAQKKNKDEYRKIINNLHPQFNVIEEKDKHSEGCIHFVINNKELLEHLKPLGKSRDKFVPKNIKRASRRQIRLFLETYTLGDASKSEKGNTIRFNTTSKRLADDLQELAIKAGCKFTRIWKRKNIEYYEVKVSKRYAFLSGNETERRYYDGKVYCVTVPSNIICVRRNGSAMWCGNCLQRTWIRPLTQKEYEIHLTWRSRDAYGAWSSNLCAILWMLRREVLPDGVKIVKLVDFCDSAHIYDYDWDVARKVRLVK